MNAIKNALITTTLIAVGYGVYVILASPNSPGPALLQRGNPWTLEGDSGAAGAGDDDDWGDLSPPDVSMPGGETLSADSGLVDPSPSPFGTDHAHPNAPDPMATSNAAGIHPVPGSPNGEAMVHAAPAFGSPPSSSSNPHQVPAPAEQLGQAMREANDAVNQLGNALADSANSAVDAQRRQAHEFVDDLGRDVSQHIQQHLVPQGSDGSHSNVGFDAPAVPGGIAANAVTPAAPADRDYGQSSANRSAVAEEPVQQPGLPVGQSPTGPATGAPMEVQPNVDANGFLAAWETARRQIEKGEMANALFSLSIWYQDQSLTAEQREQCLNLMDQLAGTVIYSREHHLQAAYVVRDGDTLTTIAEQFQVPAEFLARVNGIEPPYQLASAQPIKVVQGPFRAEVDVQLGLMTLFAGPYYAGRFPVESNAQNVPLGRYELTSKTADPAFVDRQNGTQIPGGSPENPYGKHWLGLRNETTPPDLRVGLHGTSEQPSSRIPAVGSLRLSMRDIDDVQAILSLGSVVTIR